VNKLVSGWGFSGQTAFQSGFPLSFTQSVNSVTDGAYAYYFGGTKRPDVVAACNPVLSGRGHPG
jgi:hypothetical protein